MKAPAVIASVTIACSFGFAAGQGRTAMPSQDMATPPVPPKDSMTRGGSGSQGGVAMQVGGADDCVVIGEPIWMFGDAHPIPSCLAASWGDAGIIARGRMMVDLNGDGEQDRVVAKHSQQVWTGTELVCLTSYLDSGDFRWCQSDSQRNVLWLETLTWTGNTVTVVRQAICRDDTFNMARVRLQDYNPGWDYSNLQEWKAIDFRDVDDDGDADLIVKLGGGRMQYGTHVQEPFTEYLWLENTASFNTSGGADVNRDGVVNGQDLAYVLSAWTP
jgi:hypothetical protein